MHSEEIRRLFDTFSSLKVVVIGDVMVDAYLWGNVDRISPEAPVPIISVTRRENRPGGAANVALNVSALGAQPVLCTVTGTDAKGDLFSEMLAQCGLTTEGVLRSSSRITTVKNRIIGGRQQILRVDEETEHDLEEEWTEKILARVGKVIEKHKADVIIFEDYDKGIITPPLIEGVISLASEKGIPVAADPKKKNFMNYGGVTLFKPNLKELREGMKADIDKNNEEQVRSAARDLRKKLPVNTLMITLSEKGIYVNNNNYEGFIEGHVRNVADVSGAGDTVISVASLCLAAGLSIKATATLSNLAGGLVCEQIGVVPVDKEQLIREAAGVLAG